MSAAVSELTLDPAARLFYGRVLDALQRAKAPFLLGGAYGLQRYTGVQRHTKDLDIFVLESDVRAVLGILEEIGCRTEITFAHWLAKAFADDHFIDIIFASGNGICRVDNAWFQHGKDDRILGRAVRLCPVEEMIWSKAFIMERERYDGSDIAHLIRAHGRRLDWPRLLERFGPNWLVLLNHLILYRYIYPSDPDAIPADFLIALLDRARQAETTGLKTNNGQVCRGTLLSREQFLIDLEEWGYQDARRVPVGEMTAEQVRQWTDAIEDERG
jgi:hypothetical protein